MIAEKNKKEEQEMQDTCIKFLQIARENNVAMLGKAEDDQSFKPFSMVIEPFKICQKQLQKLKEYSGLWQKLTHKASIDNQFILDSLQKLIKDPMIGPMLKIYQEMFSQPNNIMETGSFGRKAKILLFRTDFFITDSIPSQIKLIQYNNMSVSMAGISQQFETCQRLLWGFKKNIVQNKCTKTFASGLVSFYKKQQMTGILLVVVQQKETNSVDQNLLFEAIQKQAGIIEIQKVYLENLSSHTSLSEDGNLLYEKRPVAIVYYRAAYSSRQKIDWQGIRKCNFSKAVNIPSISQFLIGTKKMQAELSKPQNMMRYLTEQQTKTLLQSVIETWDFQKLGSKQQIIKIIQNEGSDNFVLKPNEQGGKNNLFGEQGLKKIMEESQEELLSYVLTRKIRSRRQLSNLIKSQKWQQLKVNICEMESQISIYGCVCSSPRCSCPPQCGCCSSKTVVNCCEGYLVRSKPVGVNEGGLMAGTGAICGLQLIE